MRRIVAGVCVVVTMTIGAHAASAKNYKIGAEQAECLSRHADAYLAEAQAVYIISAADCPDPPASLSDRTSASGATPEEDGDGFIVLTPEQLRCLRDNPEDVILPAGEDGVVELSFDAC